VNNYINSKIRSNSLRNSI